MLSLLSYVKELQRFTVNSAFHINLTPHMLQELYISCHFLGPLDFVFLKKLLVLCSGLPCLVKYGFCIMAFTNNNSVLCPYILFFHSL